MPYTTKIAGIEYTIRVGERERLDKYLQTGELPASFFTRAILTNDFVGTVYHADDDNLKNLPAYAHYLTWEMPAKAWGNMEKIMTWTAHSGLEGMKKYPVIGEKIC